MANITINGKSYRLTRDLQTKYPTLEALTNHLTNNNGVK